MLLCPPTWWRAARAVGRLLQPAGLRRWCKGSSSTRTRSPEPTWCPRSPVRERRWYSHTTTAAARSRTARAAGCDSAPVPPRTAGRRTRRSPQPSASSHLQLQPPGFLPAAVPVRLHHPAGYLRHDGGGAASYFSRNLSEVNIAALSS